MLFPKTPEEFEKFIADDHNINCFLKMLQARRLGLQPPLSKTEADSGIYAEQPHGVRELFAMGCPHGKCLETGWEYRKENYDLDWRVYYETIKLGHILNKLAEFNDKELEESFVAKMAAKLGETTEETGRLLQEFHIFTKTETASIGQIKAVNSIFEMWKNEFNKILSEYEFDPNYFEYTVSSNQPVLPVGRCYSPGYPDCIFLFRHKKNPEEVFVIIAEYDGIPKTQARKEQREKRWQSLLGSAVKIGPRELEGKVISVSIVDGINKSEMSENLFNALRGVICKEDLLRYSDQSSAANWLLQGITTNTRHPYALPISGQTSVSSRCQ